jgi:glutamate 5-kinase
MGALKISRRPTDLASLQACAAVGQSRLMSAYDALFGRFDQPIAQVLLTHEDLKHHERHLNARNTLVTLLEKGVVPVINENDAVSATELKFGDNDKLSALVACLLPADLLVILTTVEGLIENFGRPSSRLLTTVTEIDAALEELAGGTDNAVAVGGMASKLKAARIVMRTGIPMVIASGRNPKILQEILDGAEIGTWFVPQRNKLKGRKRWIAFFHYPQGSLIVDDGARKALRDLGRSLLLPGLIRCEGRFVAGDIVRICDEQGTEFARGIVEFDTQAIRARDIPRTEIVHRDNLVIL